MPQPLVKLIMILVVVTILFAAALLEVYGDDKIRLGFRGRYSFIVLGGFILVAYGLTVNAVNLVFKWVFHSEQWSLSTLLGIYVGFFALVSVIFDAHRTEPWNWQRPFDRVPRAVLLGLGFIFVGGLIIQWGEKCWLWLSRYR